MVSPSSKKLDRSITFKAPIAMEADLKNVAIAEDRTVSFIVRKAVESFLARSPDQNSTRSKRG